MPKDAIISKEKVTLLEVLDRVLDKGVTITGDITISVANVDLIYIALRVLISSIETMERLKDSDTVHSSETTSVATGIGF
ncbi:gas vesicle protein [Candidatus Poribacteria bacterium]|nr:gas vesicle protein [Candidatus Poribacteria bacterium]